MLKKLLNKTISLVLITLLNYLAFLSFGTSPAFAYFNDEETSTGNTYSAGTLDFSLSSPQNNFGPRPEVALDMMPGDSATREIIVRNEGSLDLQYHGRTEKILGDDDFCNGLQLIAKLNGEINYDGGLMDFNSLGLPLSFGSEDNWFFIAYLPYESNFVNKVCQFKFVFEAWQDNIISYGDGGFDDTEEISSKLASWGLRINEVYYRGDNKGEFVELYNQTDSSIDLTNWKIEDNTSSDTLPSVVISGKRFAVIITKESTVTGIHPLAMIITLDNLTIGNGLADSGDRVLLLSPSPDETEIDAMSYGTDTSVFSLAGVPSGHSLARRIAGYDTDQSSDWEDLAVPSPGINPHLMSEEEIITEEFISEETIEEDLTEAAAEAGNNEEETVIPEENTPEETNEEAIEEAPISGDSAVIEEYPEENEEEPAPLQGENQSTSSSSPEILDSSTNEISEFASGDDEIATPTDASSEVPEILSEPPLEFSSEPLPEPLSEPLATPSSDGEPTPESTNDSQLPADDESSVQAPAEPAILAEPITVESPTEPTSPPADPPDSPSAEAPAPADSTPAPSPAE